MLLRSTFVFIIALLGILQVWAKLEENELSCGARDIFSRLHLTDSLIVSSLSSAGEASVINNAYILYNLGVKYHRALQTCDALGCYLAALDAHREFPEAYQNAAIILSDGCNNNNDARRDNMTAIMISREGRYFLPDAMTVAYYFHEQSFVYGRTNDFKSESLSNLIMTKLKMNHFNSKAEMQSMATLLLSILQSIHNIDYPDTNKGLIWPVGPHNSLCRLYEAMGEHNMSFEHMQLILQAHPAHHLSILNLGNHYFRNNQWGKAVQFYVKSLHHIPVDDMVQRVYVMNNVAQAMRMQDQFVPARMYLEQALSNHYLDSNNVNRLEQYKSLCGSDVSFSGLNCELQLFTAMNFFAIQTLDSHWRHMEYIEALIEKSTLLLDKENIKDPSIRISDPYTHALIRFGSRRAFAKAPELACNAEPIFTLPTDQFASPSVQYEGGSRGNKRRRLLKVGYLSGDWRDHPMGRLTQALVTTHNISRVFSYSISYGDSSSNSFVRQKVMSTSPHFLDLEGIRSDEDAYQMIKELNLDILVDLMGHTTKNRIGIVANKPAPLVVNYLGFAGSSGCSAVDVSMVDRVVSPPEYVSECFVEKVVYLPYTYQANTLPPEIGPCNYENGHYLCRNRFLNQYIGIEETRENKRDKNSMSPDTAVEYLEWTRPEHTLLCAFNANKKLEPVSFAAWMNIMVENPTSVLLLLASGNARTSRKNLINVAALYGIHKSRLQFLGKVEWEDHLYRLAACDIFLDNFAYGAHTTLSDALYMWVPTLTLRAWGAHNMPSRVGNSLLSSLGEDISTILLHDNIKYFEKMASELIQNTRSRRNLRELLAQRVATSPTFNHKMMQRVVESTYEAMFELQQVYTEDEIDRHIVIGYLPYPVYEELSLMKDIQAKVQHCLSSAPAGVLRVDVSYSSAVSLQSTGCSDDNIASLLVRLDKALPRERKREGPWQQLLLSLRSQHQQVDIRGERNLAHNQQMLRDFKNVLHQSHQHYLTNRDGSGGKGDLLLSKLPYYMETYRNYPRQFLDVIIEVLHYNDYDCSWKLHINTLLAPLLIYSKDSPIVFDEKRWKGVLSPQLVKKMQHSLPEMLMFSMGTSLHSDTKDPLFIQLLTESSESPKSIEEAKHGISSLLSDMSVCTLQQRDEKTNGEDSMMKKAIMADAIILMLNSYTLHSSPLRLRNLGLMMQHWNHQIGFSLLNEAVVMEHRERHAAYLSDLPSNIHDGERYSNQLSIAIYCYEYGNAYWGQWGPSSLVNGGLGGSEEAVVFLAEALVKVYNYDITVYADPSPHDLMKHSINGVRWRHHSAFDVDRPEDVFISWRYGASLGLGYKASRRFLWLQDLVSWESLPTLSVMLNEENNENNETIILVLSDFHRTFTRTHLLRNGYTDKRADESIAVLPNGIDLRYASAMDGQNNPHQFVYGSSPIRGLEQLLRVWPEIKRALPLAQLSVYYGFPPHVTQQLEKSMGKEGFAAFKTRIMSHLDQLGVTYYGAVDHQTLAEAYSRAGFLLYPTNYPETGCISVQKSMASGAFPITSRYSTSVLPYLTREYDLGPEDRLTPERNYTQWMDEHYVPAVITAVTQVTSEDTAPKMIELREKMKSSIRSTYGWTQSARKLSALFNGSSVVDIDNLV